MMMPPRLNHSLAAAHGELIGAHIIGAEATEMIAELVMAGRSHNVAAQATTLGKRFATAADEA